MESQYWFSMTKIVCWALILGGCFLVTVAHFIMEPFRWNHCYRVVGHGAGRSRGVRDALLCTAFATYVLPFKLGIPLRIFLLRRHGDMSGHFVGVVIALDGLTSLVTWAILSVLCGWAAALHWSPPWYLWAVIVAGMVVCIVAVMLRRSIGLCMLQRLRDALALLDQPWRRINRSVMVLTIDVLSYGLRHALLLLLVTGHVKGMLIAGAIGIIATFAGIVSGLPMGLVGYDATLIALFTLVGIRPEQALLIAVINRALNLASAAVLGIPAAMRLGLGSTVGSIIKKIREIANGGT